VGDRWATLVEDHASGSARRSIYCPLYPLAEWVAYNWWFLQADSRPAKVLGRLDELGTGDFTNLPRIQRDRHSVRASGDGFAWPDLWIVPEGNQRTRLVWLPDSAMHQHWPITFISWGDMRADSHAVTLELGRMVSEVITRLREQGIAGTSLEKEWDEILQTDEEEAEYCRAAARLGLDPYSMPEHYESAIVRAAEALPEGVFGDLMDAADPGSLSISLDWVIRLSEEMHSLPVARTGRLEMPSLSDEVRNAPSERFEQPWELGWEQAKRIRAASRIASPERFLVENYVSSVHRKSPDADLLGVGSTNEQGIPVTALGKRTGVSGERFSLARSMWHFAYEPGHFFLVTGAYTDRLKTERAFAAELLAPAAGIAERLGADPRDATEEDIEEVARYYGVQPLLISHQVRNQLMPQLA
jgi:Zn-dependent peptidase ImmA (M78 family)